MLFTICGKSNCFVPDRFSDVNPTVAANCAQSFWLTLGVEEKTATLTETVRFSIQLVRGYL